MSGFRFGNELCKRVGRRRRGSDRQAERVRTDRVLEVNLGCCCYLVVVSSRGFPARFLSLKRSVSSGPDPTPCAEGMCM